MSGSATTFRICLSFKINMLIVNIQTIQRYMKKQFLVSPSTYNPVFLKKTILTFGGYHGILPYFFNMCMYVHIDIYAYIYEYTLIEFFYLS